MTNGCSDTLLATIVEGNNTTVAQWQLNLTLTLLTGNLTCYRTVHLVRQPVLTSHSLQLEHAVEVFVNLILAVGHVLVVALYSIILHDGLWRVTKHLGNIQIEWLHTIALLEREVGIAGGLTNHIQRSTLAISNFSYVLNVLLIDEQPHTLLTLIGNDLLARKGLIANRQLGHINLATALFNEL